MSIIPNLDGDLMPNGFMSNYTDPIHTRFYILVFKFNLHIRAKQSKESNVSSSQLNDYRQYKSLSDKEFRSCKTIFLSLQ